MGTISPIRLSNILQYSYHLTQIQQLQVTSDKKKKEEKNPLLLPYDLVI